MTVAGFAVIVKSQLLFGLGRLGAEIGSRIGSALGHGIDAIADIGTEALSLGEGAIDGPRLFDLGSKADSNNYHETADSGSNEYNAGSGSAESSELSRRHQRHYHKHRRHHTSITKVGNIYIFLRQIIFYKGT